MVGEMTTRVLAQPFFAELPVALVRELCAFSQPIDYRAGSVIFGEGGPANRFWLVERGVVALDLHVPGRGEQVIESIGAGTLLGWSWLYPPYRWRFGATARTDVSAIGFDAVGVRRRCDADPQLGYAILSRLTPVVAERLQATRLRLIDLWGVPGTHGQPTRGPAPQGPAPQDPPATQGPATQGPATQGPAA